MFCPACGTENDDDARFCDACGSELPQARAASSGSAHMDADGNGVPDVLEQAAPTTVMGSAPTTVMGAEPTTVMGAEPTTVLSTPDSELDETRVAPQLAAQRQPHQYEPAPAPAPVPAPVPKKRGNKGILIAVLAAVALGCAGFGFMTWRNYQAELQAAEQARLDQEAAEKVAAEKRLSHQVILPVSAPGLDAGGSRIPLRITGTDFEGNTINESVYVSHDGAGISVPKGSYELTVLASPIASDGTVYEIPAGTFTFEVPDTQPNGSDYQASGTLAFMPLDPADAVDALEQALQFARNDPEMSADAVSALSEAANAKVAAAQSQAAHDEAVRKAQADGLTVLSGTVHVMTAAELAEMQGTTLEQIFGGYPPYGAEEIFVIVEFSQPVSITARHSGDEGNYFTDITTLIHITNQDPDAWTPYEGREITIAISPDETWWPSDVRLPLGAPSTHYAKVID